MNLSAILTVALLIPLMLAAPGKAEEHGHAHPGTAYAHSQARQAKATDVQLLDLELLDSHERPVHFKSDVIGDRIVALNFIFTTCPSICPIQSAIFARLQDELGDRLGREVTLISISIDPKTDVPERLRAYAKRYHARPGWLWLTGEKDKIDRVLVALGAYSSAVEEHAAMILVGDGRNGGWTRFYGFPKPSAILARLDELVAARNAGGDSSDTVAVR